MKKSVIIAIIAVVILAVIGGVIFVNLNKEKASITASSFYTTMSHGTFMWILIISLMALFLFAIV